MFFKRPIAFFVCLLMPFLLLWGFVAVAARSVDFDMYFPVLGTVGNVIENAPLLHINWSFSSILPSFSFTGVSIIDFFINIWNALRGTLDFLVYIVQSLANILIFVGYFLRYLFTGSF